MESINNNLCEDENEMSKELSTDPKFSGSTPEALAPAPESPRKGGRFKDNVSCRKRKRSISQEPQVLCNVENLLFICIEH